MFEKKFEKKLFFKKICFWPIKNDFLGQSQFLAKKWVKKSFSRVQFSNEISIRGLVFLFYQKMGHKILKTPKNT